VARTKSRLFIDGANLYATAKSLGFDIDYNFRAKAPCCERSITPLIIDDQEYSSIRPLINWLDYNGYTVVTKATKEFIDAIGRRKVKGNMDVELAVDAMELARACRSDRAVLRRRRFPLAGRSGTAPRRPRHRGLDDFEPATDDCR
jgi:uncharacterized LabA/DUF88 family protein